MKSAWFMENNYTLTVHHKVPINVRKSGRADLSTWFRCSWRFKEMPSICNFFLAKKRRCRPGPGRCGDWKMCWETMIFVAIEDDLKSFKWAYNWQSCRNTGENEATTRKKIQLAWVLLKKQWNQLTCNCTDEQPGMSARTIKHGKINQRNSRWSFV